MKRIGIVFGIAFFVAACSTPQPESEPAPAETPAAEAAAPAAKASPEERLAAIRAELEEVKAELNEAGRYNCCVQPACNWCALHEGECSCFTNVQAGEAVCPGCGLGWHNGQGIVEGVDPSEVKWEITHEHPAEGGHAH